MPSVIVKQTSERFKAGMKDVNELDNDVFQVIMDMLSKQADVEEIAEFLEKNGHSSLDCMTIRIIQSLYQKASRLIVKPTTLQNDLHKELQLDEDKSEIFLKTWIAETKPIIDNLDVSKDNCLNELESLDWRLDVELMSSEQTTKKIPVGVLQLQTSNNNQTTLTFDHKGMLELYGCLESLQQELDSFK